MLRTTLQLADRLAFQLVHQGVLGVRQLRFEEPPEFYEVGIVSKAGYAFDHAL